jgi:signal transduction histidine kinase
LAFAVFEHGLAKAREVKLSTWVTALFAIALVLPWIAMGWLISTAQMQAMAPSAVLATLVVRSVLTAGVGAFLVQQLRWRERAQIELDRAREAAETASRAKSEFLANMSHELRTPLNAIIGFSEMIRNGMAGPLSTRYRDYGGDILSSGRHLLNLINEILDLSKLEAGQFRLNEEFVDLAATVRASLRFVEAQAASAKVELRSNGLTNLPLIHADERRVLQVLINLLSNAVKFTQDGGSVSVAVAIQKDGLRIEVRDSGIGMAPEEVAKALEPFGQIESALSRNREGTGLGLPLAKRLVDMHGGSLSLSSEPGVGTVATIMLPLERIVANSAHLVAV